MFHEEGFLESIAAQPRNRLTRLIYADWLEEHGDARADLIRAAEALHALTPLDDGYWDAKRHARDLRAGQADDWLKALGYDFAYRPLLRKLPISRDRRWRLIDQFIDLWHAPLDADSGIAEEEISVVESRLGRTLPPVMRQWYRLAGKRLDVWSDHGQWFPVNDLSVTRQGELLFFEIDKQIVTCELTDEIDPKIHYRDGVQRRFEEEIRLSEFIIMALLFSTMWQPKHFIPCPAKSFGQFRHQLRGLSRAHLPAECGDWQINFWEGEDYLIGSTDAWAFFAFRTQAARKSFPFEIAY